jgi:probable rRNA maturation factor
MTQLELDIQTEISLEEETIVALYETVETLLAYEEISDKVSLTILITDDEQMRQLNRDFAGLDEPTDVLSFSPGEGGEMTPGEMTPGEMTPGEMTLGEIMPEELDGYLGDIAISLTQAEKQAAAGGHSLTAELQLLTVHGVLHLLDYDHYDEEDREAMWAAQKAVLDSLGVEVTIPSYDE